MPVDVTVEDGCAWLTLNRPEVLNALNAEMLTALDKAVRAADEDDDIRVIVLQGAGGRAFSTGADLREAAPARARGRPRVRAYPQVTRPGEMPGFDALARCGTPVVAAIDGYCVAGGFELALLCDIRLASERSMFWISEPRLGMLGGPAVIHLSRAIPLGEAMWLHLTGQRMDARRAHQIGLVQEVAADREELDRCVRRVVENITAGSAPALEFVKRVVREGRDMSVEQQWRLSEMFNFVLRGTGDSMRRAQDWVDK